MRRILLLPLVLAAMAGFGGFANAAVASANSCSNISVGDFGLTSTSVNEFSFSKGTCASRWTARASFQYEDGGTWHLPSGLGSNGGGQSNCPSVDTFFADRWCYGTAQNNGTLPGFTGAGNQLIFGDNDEVSMTMTGSHGASVCNYNWRDEIDFYDYASGSLVRSANLEHAAGTLC